MQRRLKKRKSSGRFYETVPNLKQSRIGPSPRRIIRDRHPTWSAPNMRQQSITQMDVLRDYYHPDLENEYLKTDDEEDSYVASPTRNKRRKVTPETPQARKIETRSVKRQAAEEEPVMSKQEDQNNLSVAREEVKLHYTRATIPTALLPPKTPMSLRRKEIPSSQSPADTPLSMHSRHSLHDYTRSPLKEKSTNLNLPIKSPKKGTTWSKRLEVADSMETEDEDSPVSVQLGLTSDFVSNTAEPEDTTDKEPQIPSNAFAIHVDDFNERLKAAQRPGQDIQKTGQASSRHEINDSTDEEDEEEAQAFNAGQETQTALASTDVSQKGSDQPPKSTTSTSKPAEDEPKLGSVQRHASELPIPLNAPCPPVRKNEIETHLPTQKPKKVDFVNLSSSDLPTPPTPSHIINRPSDDTEEVSAQLLADLHRETQPYGLQTESQFEKGWTTYTPADDNDEDDNDNIPSESDLEPHPSTTSSLPKPFIEDHPSSSALMTVPTQLIRPPFSSPPLFYKAPIPPSQATTVDVTQPSPRTHTHNITSSPQRSSPQTCKLPSPSSRPCPPPLSSSPPPPIPPPSSSSPLARRRTLADSWEGFQWNGKRLTDSQLLPDSLLDDDSQGGPPPPLLPMVGFSQESWGEEEEEEEEEL